MTRSLDYKELARHLGFAPQTLKKTWRCYPHYFPGSGRTLKSARFDLDDVLDYLKGRDYAGLQGGQEISGGVRVPGQEVHQGGLYPKSGRSNMGGQRKKQAQKSAQGDKWGLFRSLK